MSTATPPNISRLFAGIDVSCSLIRNGFFYQNKPHWELQYLKQLLRPHLESFPTMGEVFLDKTLSLLSSDKQKTRSEGLADLKHILQRNKSSKL